MNSTTNEIRIKQGYGTLFFGITIDAAVGILGKPDEIEELEGLEDDVSMAYIYENNHLIAFFEGMENKILTILETRDPESTLFGEKIFNKDELQIHELMKNNGFQELDTEILSWGGKRMTFEDANVDFYFENNKLTSVNWGVLLSPADFGTN